MSLHLIIPGVSFTYYNGIVGYPVSDSLTSLFMIGDNEADSLVNLVSGQSEATVTGSITYGDYHGVFSGEGRSNYIEIPDRDDETDVTLISVFKMPTVLSSSPAGRVIFGAFNGNLAGTNMLHFGAYSSNGTTGASTMFANPAPASETYFRMKAITVSSSAVTTYDASSGVVSQTNTAARTRAANTLRNLRVGGNYGTITGYNDTAHIAMVSKHDAALTIEQLQSIYTYLRMYYTNRSVAIA